MNDNTYLRLGPIYTDLVIRVTRTEQRCMGVYQYHSNVNLVYDTHRIHEALIRASNSRSLTITVTVRRRSSLIDD